MAGRPTPPKLPPLRNSAFIFGALLRETNGLFIRRAISRVRGAEVQPSGTSTLRGMTWGDDFLEMWVRPVLIGVIDRFLYVYCLYIVNVHVVSIFMILYLALI